MQYFYDGQIRRYLTQIIRLLSNFVVRYSDGTLVRVPVMYGDMDRQVANIINQNSENALPSTPKIAVYVSEFDLDRNRLGDATFVGKLHIRERDVVDGQYTGAQGLNYTVERLMPTPFNLTVKVDIWSSSTEQKLQILEQILTLFNPSLEIQTTDNYIDWTSLSVVDLNDVNFSSRTVPVGTATSIDIATITLQTPVWLSPPAKVKKLGVITNVITSIFDNITPPGDDYIEGLGTDITLGQGYPINPMLDAKATIGNYDIEVDGKSIRVVNAGGNPRYLDWTVVFNQYPGKYRPGLTKVRLRQPDGSYVIGYATINALDGTILTVSEWDIDTYPSNNAIPGVRAENAWGSFDAIIDPTKTGPSNLEVGTRYLIIEGIGGGVRDSFINENRINKINTGIDYNKVNDYKLVINGTIVDQGAPDPDINDVDGTFYIVTASLIPIGSNITYVVNLNEDGPDAWKNLDGTDFIAEANDIIEWDGAAWQVVFSAQESSDLLIYQTNIYTLVQYKWNGVSWVKSFEGDYKRGDWRIEL